ncbi:MAG: co-chaperone GroES family protein [Ignavibacteria bacterium]|nr:co-chaperone GroES family protein [Ignavibacteria bacterium]
MTKQLIVVGDRVLISPDESADRTSAGLYLPPGVKEKEKVQSGWVVKTGPGYPIPNPDVTDDEPWKEKKETPKYIPLQAKEGDYAIFLREQAIEFEYEQKKYLIVPQHAILVLLRDDFLV